MKGFQSFGASLLVWAVLSSSLVAEEIISFESILDTVSHVEHLVVDEEGGGLLLAGRGARYHAPGAGGVLLLDSTTAFLSGDSTWRIATRSRAP